MKGQTEFLREVVTWLVAADVPHMVVGSLSSSYHGEPRSTQDIDIVIDPTAPQLRALLASLPSSVYVSDQAAHDAMSRRGMFNIVDIESGWKADLIFRKHHSFGETEFRRREQAEIAGVSTFVASPEDVILSKLLWMNQGAGERQMRDVVAVLSVVRDHIDQRYLDRWAESLGLAKLLAEARSQCRSEGDG